MKKLKELVSLCQASVEIFINEHRSCYESVEQYISDGEKTEIEPELFSEMVRRDTMIRIEAYPNTPICFHTVYHYDIDQAVERAVELLKRDKPQIPNSEFPTPN